MVSAPDWTNFAGMLSTPADFPIVSALNAAFTSSRRVMLVYVGSHVQLGPHQCNNCKSLSSTMNI